MKYARCTWIVVAICLVLSVVSGAQTITLTFLGNDSGESERLLYERLFEEFERRHPNVIYASTRYSAHGNIQASACAQLNADLSWDGPQAPNTG